MKKSRQLELMEVRASKHRCGICRKVGHNARRHRGQYRCSICHQLGHNARSPRHAAERTAAAPAAPPPIADEHQLAFAVEAAA